MATTPRTQAPGLRWSPRSGGSIPVWYAPKDIIAAGYRPARVELHHLKDKPELLKARCALLQAEMKYWIVAGGDLADVPFDGTVREIIRIYREHPQSSFHNLKMSAHKSYSGLLRRLSNLIGERQVDSITGIDLIAWKKEWSNDGKSPSTPVGMRKALFSAVTFGCALRLQGCVELSTALRSVKREFKSSPPRNKVVTFEQVEDLRAAAHRHGRPSRALAYAICFEVTLRLADAVGQWWPAKRGRVSDVVHPFNGDFWFGLRWEFIDDDLVLRCQPSKTADTSGSRIVFPLTSAPMVMEEIRHTPLKQRVGPMVVNEATGVPYTARAFNDGWHKDRDAVRIPSDVWARDLRASGITEGRAAGAALEDAAKVAGHAGTTTTGLVYDRAVLEASQRFTDTRVKKRRKKRLNS